MKQLKRLPEDQTRIEGSVLSEPISPRACARDAAVPAERARLETLI